MALRHILNDINYSVNNVETGFNIAGAVPVVGAIPSVLRILIAKVQMVAASVLFITGAVGYVVTSVINDRLNRDFEDLTRFGLQHLGHGFLNYCRGILEIFGQATTLGAANIIVNLIPDHKFTAFVPYGRI